MTDYRIQSNRRRVEEVDLQPYGNTISVETISDNPFEDAQDVEVFTQANDGFGGPAPASMRSKRIITKPSAISPMWAGRVSATKMRAPAHKPHTGFAPGINGLGETPGGTTQGQPTPPGLLSQLPGVLTSLATTAGQVYSTQQATQQQRAQAAMADAQARAADAEARRAAMMAPVTAMQQHSGISGTMLAIGGLAAVAALFMFLRKKK